MYNKSSLKFSVINGELIITVGVNLVYQYVDLIKIYLLKWGLYPDWITHQNLTKVALNITSSSTPRGWNLRYCHPRSGVGN